MKQLHPRAIWLFFLSGSLTSIIGTLPIIYLFFVFLDIMEVAKKTPGIWVPGIPSPLHLIWIVLLIIIVKYIWAYLTWKFYKYELREDGFRKEHGVIWKKYVSIPYSRIQNVDVYRGILARLLGLSDIQVQTAGGITMGSYGAFSEGRLPGIAKEEAELLRDELIRRARVGSGQAAV